jgi:F0F1-type ATP synthase membrane subunit a
MTFRFHYFIHRCRYGQKCTYRALTLYLIIMNMRRLCLCLRLLILKNDNMFKSSVYHLSCPLSTSVYVETGILTTGFRSQYQLLYEIQYLITILLCCYSRFVHYLNPVLLIRLLVHLCTFIRIFTIGNSAKADHIGPAV